MSKSIYRYEVPADGQWHGVDVTGDIVHVAVIRRVDVVELWALHSSVGQPQRRWLRVFGTGHPLPDGPLWHVGTAIAAGGELVWHLMERPA